LETACNAGSIALLEEELAELNIPHGAFFEKSAGRGIPGRQLNPICLSHHAFEPPRAMPTGLANLRLKPFPISIQRIPVLGHPST